jgi:DNA repair exonuclease SbcCD ATPase subunit
VFVQEDTKANSFCVMQGTKDKPGAKVKCFPAMAAAVLYMKMKQKQESASSDSSEQLADGKGVNALRAMHDRLLVEQPEGAVHDEDACPLCGSEDDDTEGGWMATFSEEELQAAIEEAIDAATGPLKNRIAELEASQQQSEADSALTDLKAKIAELESQLDAAVLEASQAKEEKDNLQKAWDDEKAEADAATELAARRDERLQKVREVASFPDDYLEKNADRFAAMSDEDFTARLEEWQTLASKQNGGPPRRTALTAARQEDDGTSNLALLKEFRRTMTDPRTL